MAFDHMFDHFAKKISIFISGCGPVGRALDLGSRCREFESPHSDQLKRLISYEISRFLDF